MNLNLDQNQLSSLFLPSNARLPSIRSIKLTENFFSSIDLTPFPSLRIIYMDQNRLGSSVTGLSRLKNLDAVSFRGQTTGQQRMLGEGQYRECELPIVRLREARKLYLSAPQYPLDLFSGFRTPFLNLQYLELASAQVSALPKTFGAMIPNVRVLNLNSNAIKDLRPLRPCALLRKLLVAGNRLKNLKMLAGVLEYWPALAYLDVRGNPLTIGFYPAAAAAGAIVPVATPGIVAEPGEYEARPFELPDRAEHGDDEFTKRLDWETRLKRRRWEALVGGKCAKMRSLDGGAFRRDRVFAEDRVWEEMVERGWVDGDE